MYQELLIVVAGIHMASGNDGETKCTNFYCTAHTIQGRETGRFHCSAIAGHFQQTAVISRYASANDAADIVAISFEPVTVLPPVSCTVHGSADVFVFFQKEGESWCCLASADVQV